MAEFGIGSFAPMVPQKISPNLATKAPQMEPKSPQATSGASFMEMLQSAIGNVNESLATADKSAQNFAKGDAQNLHDVMISMEKADISLRTLTAVRGKILEAYQEVMKMPV